jgi:hypothetical protein
VLCDEDNLARLRVLEEGFEAIRRLDVVTKEDKGFGTVKGGHGGKYGEGRQKSKKGRKRAKRERWGSLRVVEREEAGDRESARRERKRERAAQRVPKLRSGKSKPREGSQWRDQSVLMSLSMRGKRECGYNSVGGVGRVGSVGAEARVSGWGMCELVRKRKAKEDKERGERAGKRCCRGRESTAWADRAVFATRKELNAVSRRKERGGRTNRCIYLPSQTIETFFHLSESCFVRCSSETTTSSSFRRDRRVRLDEFRSSRGSDMVREGGSWREEEGPREGAVVWIKETVQRIPSIAGLRGDAQVDRETIWAMKVGRDGGGAGGTRWGCLAVLRGFLSADRLLLAETTECRTQGAKLFLSFLHFTSLRSLQLEETQTSTQ